MGLAWATLGYFAFIIGVFATIEFALWLLDIPGIVVDREPTEQTETPEHVAPNGGLPDADLTRQETKEGLNDEWN